MSLRSCGNFQFSRCQSAPKEVNNGKVLALVTLIWRTAFQKNLLLLFSAVTRELRRAQEHAPAGFWSFPYRLYYGTIKPVPPEGSLQATARATRLMRQVAVSAMGSRWGSLISRTLIFAPRRHVT